MGTTVEIRFNKDTKSYWAGEMVTGKVIVESDDEKCLRLIKGLRVRCKGTATVDLKFGGSETVVNFVDEDAKLFTDKLVKTSSMKNDVKIIHYEYPFQFQLHKDLPSSFKTPYGKMEYLLKASLPSGASISYFEGRGYFNVVAVLDLNTKKAYRQPVELKLEATMTTLLLGDSGVVNFFLSIPHKAYAIGDNIQLHQEIDNKSKQHVKASISLIQKITYQIMGSVRLDKENKMKIVGKEVAPMTKDICTDQIFDIPEVPISSEIRLKAENKTIKIAYFLKYEIVSRSGWTKKLKGYIPIIIGSIGFKQNNNNVNVSAESLQSLDSLSIKSSP
ncbi:unnamed protein product [Orchesella dallaii]